MNPDKPFNESKKSEISENIKMQYEFDAYIRKIDIIDKLKDDIKSRNGNNEYSYSKQ